jgi:hypothetical protein
MSRNCLDFPIFPLRVQRRVVKGGVEKEGNGSIVVGVFSRHPNLHWFRRELRQENTVTLFDSNAMS